MITQIDLKGIRICLVFPPYRESQDLFFLATAKKDLGKIPPLCLCAVAAALERYGAEVKIIDLNVHTLSLEETVMQIKEFHPDFLGFTLASYQFHFTLEWISNIRSQCGIPVIVGGWHARIYPREILSHSPIDYCILGDAEESLPALIFSLAQKKDLSKVGGIAYRDKEGAVKVNDFSLYIKDIDSVPFPARHLIDNSAYYSLISKYTNFTAMTTSRGCVFNCTFCDNHCISYRAMSPKRVVDEMEICKKEFNINEIDMFDGVFSVSKQRALRICQEIMRRKLKIFWSIRTRADLVDADILKALRQAGCIRIYYGIESGSPEILKNINKNVSLQRITDVLLMTKQNGIDTFGYFMVGNFGETEETIEKTQELMNTSPLDYVQIAPIIYPPNTQVYGEVMKVIGHDYWREYTLNPSYEIDFPIVGTAFSKSQIHSRVRRMYLQFYLRPRMIARFIWRVRSLSEINRSIKALFHMMSEETRYAVKKSVAQ